MDVIRSTTFLISLGLHAGILLAVIGVTTGGSALETGTDDDVFVVEQGIAIEGVAKLGEAEEMVETIDIPPVQQAQLKPPESTDVVPTEEEPRPEPPQAVKPELAELITSKESEYEDSVVEREPEPIPEEKHEEILSEQKPDHVAEKKHEETLVEQEPEPILEKKDVPEGDTVDEQPAQVALRVFKSSGQAQTGGDTTQRRAYLGKLRRTLEQNKINPRSRQNGTVLIIFKVDASGQLVSRKVKKSSGSKLLDDAAIAALDRAAPFPPMPENVAQGPLEVQVPFKFVTR